MRVVFVALGIFIAALSFFFFTRRPTQPSPSAVKHARPPVATPEAASSHQAPATTPAHQAQVTRVATLGWGDGPAQVGRRRDPEAAHEGPMAIALGRDGSMWVLDQVNGRVLHRDRNGGYATPIRVRATAQDLRADAEGVAVLDRLGAQTLQRFGADGQALEERPLSSYGVAVAGGTTGLFDDADGALYIEESLAGQGLRVLHGVGSDALLAGRPSRGGTELLSGVITSRDTGALTVRGMERDGSERFATPLSVGRTIVSIALLDSDRRGSVYVGVLHAMPSGRDLIDERLSLFRLSARGALLAKTSIAHAPSALESFRALAVSDDGTVTWMHPLPDDGSAGETGMAIETIAF